MPSENSRTKPFCRDLASIHEKIGDSGTRNYVVALAP